jgi:hypothetical protein
MERVTFLLEDTGARLVCMLNPETLTVRRQAGVQPRRSVHGVVTGKGLADNQLLYTGGGKTELDLELLFDIQLSGSSVMTEDVRGSPHRYGIWPKTRLVLRASGTRRKSVSSGEKAGISLALSLVSRSGSNNLPLRGYRSGLGCGCS